LPPGILADAASAFPEFVGAGAVAHDSGYYLWKDPDAHAVAERLHGRGGYDSFEPFRRLAGRESSLPEGLAFGFGALSHLAADVVFHPLVYAWTGSEDSEDDQVRWGWPYRHAACETALDSHLEKLWGPPPFRSVARLKHRCGPQLISLQTAFSGANAGPLISAHARRQNLFHRRWASWLAHRFRGEHPHGRGDWSSSFYPRKPELHPAFEGLLEWEDPVTGQSSRLSLGELLENYDAFVADLVQEWSLAWHNHREPFAGVFGPCLDTGLTGRTPQIQRYSQIRWF